MIKKIVIAGLCMVLGSSLNAGEISENKTFLGLEVGYSEVQGERLLLGEDTYFENTDKDVMLGIRLGIQNEEWRTMLVFDYYDNKDSDQNVEHGLLTVDYFFLGREYTSETTLTPYIGGNLGYANYESSFVDASGMTYGAQAGFIVDVSAIIDLDFSYRYSLSTTDELDHMGSFVFAVNYMY